MIVKEKAIEKENIRKESTQTIGESKSFFTINYTNFAKGVAVLILLFHHLGIEPGLNFFNNSAIGYNIALQCKVCVSIFVILSGYGLNTSFNSKVKEDKCGLKSIKFTLKHLFKLLMNYWIIYLIFVSIGHFTGLRTINEVYGLNSLYSNIFFDFFGLADFAKTPIYNVTWWFMSLIIIFYILFPFLKLLLKKAPTLYILVIFVLGKIVTFEYYPAFNTYILSFGLGMLLSEYLVFDRIRKLQKNRIETIIASIILLIIGFYTRYKFGELYDTLAAFSVIVFCNEVLFTIINKGGIALQFLGKHSSNIFMMHTFIYRYFCKDWFIKLGNGLLMFILLTLSSLLISIVIELIKKYAMAVMKRKEQIFI